MPADASIYGMIRQPEPVNKLAQLAQVMQMQGLQQQGEMNALKMAEFQQGQERKNKLQALLMGMPADAGDDARINALKGQGFFDEADKLADTITKREKTKAETTTARATALGKYLDFGKQAAGQVFAMPTLENAMSALDQMEQHASALGLPVDAIAKQRQMIAGFTSSDQIRQWAAGQAMQAQELLPKIQTRNLGGTTDTLAIDPLTGAARVTNSVQNTQSPDSAASVAATMRGQNMADARARESNNIQREAARTQILDTPNGPIAVDKGTSQARPVVMNGAAVPGEAAMKRQAGAGRVLDLLTQAEAIVPKATGSYAGAGVDAAARVVGQAPDGAKAIASLKAIEGALLNEMPRMEGPQSNFDVQNYKQAAGQLGDPTAPRALKMEAIKTIREIQQRYAGPQQAQGQQQAAPVTAGPFTDAEKERRYQEWKRRQLEGQR